MASRSDRAVPTAEHGLHRRAALVRLAVTGTAVLAAAPVQAQWPSRPVRIVVPYPAGGLTDIITRSLADELGRELGQPVIVDNKPGAGGAIGLQAVLQAPRDGHTVALVVPATMVTLPLTSSSYRIRPLHDFEPITAAVETHLTLVASPTLGVKTLADFVEHARRHAGRLHYGTPGAGTTFHLHNLLLARQLGIQPVHVPYQGEVQFLNDVQSGVLQYALASSSAVRPYVDAGRLVALGTTSARRSEAQPGLPTLVEQGVPFTSDGWVGYAVAAETPTGVVDRLHAAFVRVLRNPAVGRRLSELGYSVIASDRARFREVIAESTRSYALLLKTVNLDVKP